MHLPIIWIERIPLLQVYFNHVIANRAQYLNVFVLSKVLNFVLLVPPAFWFTMNLKTGHLEYRYHARIMLLLLSFFVFFFRINFSFFFFFAFWRKKIKEAFSERCSLISVILPGFVKICKKYIEVNHFLLLSCSLEK